MSDIGPGPLMCVTTINCGSCGEGVSEGRLYQCTELFDPGILTMILHGPCGCGELHPYVLLANHHHAYCPFAFVPLGDPDAEIKETGEPQDAKRVEDDCYDLPAPLRVKEPSNV